MAGKPGDQELAADGVHRLAVGTCAVLLAGRLDGEALAVDRCGDAPGTADSCVDVLCDLVHTDDHQDVERSIGDAGDTVRVAVDVHQDPVLGHGIGRSEEIVGGVYLWKEKVDGIILVSAFPCGPDSMTNELLIRRIRGIPILTLVLDTQSGMAGIETRLESFLDIIRFQKGETV